MAETIYLLDFRRGTVEEIDNSRPPRGARAPAEGEQKDQEQGAGYVLAALGSPPPQPAGSSAAHRVGDSVRLGTLAR